MQQWKFLVVVAGVALSGAMVGATWVGVRSASAQVTPTGFTRCFFGRQESVDVDNSGVVAAPDLAHTILVPPGWTVVGAGGTGGSATILLCR
jgi:hypothetical protein